MGRGRPPPRANWRRIIAGRTGRCCCARRIRLLKQGLDGVATVEGVPTAPPEVVMMVGVNGTGKTTTTGKLAAYYRGQDRTVLLCAADTFRAAAIEQLEVWAARSETPMIKTKTGGDPSAALYD